MKTICCGTALMPLYKELTDKKITDKVSLLRRFKECLNNEKVRDEQYKNTLLQQIEPLNFEKSVMLVCGVVYAGMGLKVIR